MKIVRVCTTVVARFLISLIFLSAAVNKILHWHETERSLMSTLCEWQSNIGFLDSLQDCFAKMIPITPVLLIIATLLEFLGGLSVLLGIKEKLGAALLILFLVPTTIIMHQFWFIEGSMREMQMIHFLKNMAIIGGLLMVILQNNDSDEAPFPKGFG